MGFNASEVYASDSNWLKAADLQKREHKVRIKDVALAELPADEKGKTHKKLELHFVGRDKTLLLNKTNSEAISYLHGPNTDDWIGKDVIIFPTMVDFGGRSVEAIRLRPVMASATRPPEPPPVASIDDDDIPF